MTTSMLVEIDCGTALHTVNATRYLTSPAGCTFIDPLDHILGPARGSRRSTLQRGDMVEIVGASGSGKSTLLNFLLLTTLLPHSFNLPLPGLPGATPITLGGKSQSAALIYSSSHRSPVPALVQGMRAHISHCVQQSIVAVIDSESRVAGGGARGGAAHLTALSRGGMTAEMEKSVEGVIRECMGRLRVVRAKSRYRHWALALRSLSYPMDDTLPDHGAGDHNGNDETWPGMGYAKRTGPQQLDLVCLDGLSTCFWPERHAEEERVAKRSASAAAGAGGGVPAGVKGMDDVGMRDVMEAIGALRKDMGSVVVSTTQGLWHEKRPDSSQPTAFFSSYLPHPYPSPWSQSSASHDGPPDVPTAGPTPADPALWPLTFQLTLLGRQRGLQIPTDTTLNDALGIALRNAAAGAGGGERYAAKVRMVGAGGALGTRMGEDWAFAVDDEGLSV